MKSPNIWMDIGFPLNADVWSSFSDVQMARNKRTRPRLAYFVLPQKKEGICTKFWIESEGVAIYRRYATLYLPVCPSFSNRIKSVPA